MVLEDWEELEDVWHKFGASTETVKHLAEAALSQNAKMLC